MSYLRCLKRSAGWHFRMRARSIASCSGPHRKLCSRLQPIPSVWALRLAFWRCFTRGDRKLGAAIGFFAVLHTWGQNLHLHPHLQCVVPGGGLSPDGEWKACLPGFFLPVRVLSRLFRRLFLEALEKAYADGQLQFFSDLEPWRDPSAFAQFLAPVRQTEWVVYAKPPFGGPPQVIEYLGRYTHRVAISNQRLVALPDGQ